MIPQPPTIPATESMIRLRFAMALAEQAEPRFEVALEALRKAALNWAKRRDDLTQCRLCMAAHDWRCEIVDWEILDVHPDVPARWLPLAVAAVAWAGSGGKGNAVCAAAWERLLDECVKLAKGLKR